MAWTATQINALKTVAKGAYGDVGEIVSKKLALGHWVTGGMYDMYTLKSCIHALDKGGIVLTDANYNTINELISKISDRCKGIPTGEIFTASAIAYTPTQLPSYLSTDLPSPVPAGQIIYISDLGVIAFSNGVGWVT